MWELDYKESWVLKNWCFWTVVLEKTLESSLDCKEIQSVRPKGNQSWIFIGRTDVEAETRILWPPDTKSWLIWKDPDVGVMPKSRNLPMTTREPISDARARVCITKLELGLPPYWGSSYREEPWALGYIAYIGYYRTKNSKNGSLRVWLVTFWWRVKCWVLIRFPFPGLIRISPGWPRVLIGSEVVGWGQGIS